MSDDPLIAAFDRLQAKLDSIQLDINRERLRMLADRMIDTQKDLLRLQVQLDALKLRDETPL